MNLLHIMTDHQRFDSLGMVQCGREVTPHLNRLSEESTRFTRAYNCCPLCVPARTALATGVSPLRNGVCYNDWEGRTASEQKTLHSRLYDAGYDVAHVGVHHVRVLPPLQESLPFAFWKDEEDYKACLEAGGITIREPEGCRTLFLMPEENGEIRERRYSNPRRRLFDEDEYWFKDNWFARQAEEFLEGRKGNPFALFLNLWAPHPPLVLPAPYYDLFPPEELDLPDDLGIPSEGEPAGRRRSVPARLCEGMDEPLWREAWSAHLGLLHLADQAIAKVLESLKRNKLWESTVILFSSDHGDHMGQHGMYQKMELYEQAVRVPLLIRVPGYPAGSADSLVSHLDIVPTMTELFGLREDQKSFEGLSLKPILKNHSPTAEKSFREGDFSHFLQFSGISWYGDFRRGLVTGEWKYIWSPGDEEELYHLHTDPDERINLARSPAYSETIHLLRRRCRRRRSEQGDFLPLEVP